MNMIIIFGILLLLGVIMTSLTLKKKVEGTLKMFLIFMWIYIIGFIISVFLHNFIKAMKFGGNETFFFILAIVCLIVFLVGFIGSIVLFVKERKKVDL